MMDEFQKLIQLTKDEWVRTQGVDEIENHLIKLLEFVKTYPNKRPEITLSFISLLHEGRITQEIIQFCMRELQWPEIKEEALHLQNKSKDIRQKDILQRILEVYEEKWEDEDMYKYYTNR